MPIFFLILGQQCINLFFFIYLRIGKKKDNGKYCFIISVCLWTNNLFLLECNITCHGNAFKVFFSLAIDDLMHGHTHFLAPFDMCTFYYTIIFQILIFNFFPICLILWRKILCSFAKLSIWKFVCYRWIETRTSSSYVNIQNWYSFSTVNNFANGIKQNCQHWCNLTKNHFT